MDNVSYIMQTPGADLAGELASGNLQITLSANVSKQ